MTKTYVCAVPDCPTISSGRLCEPHSRERNARQGSRHARGYNTAHVRLRGMWARRVAAGDAVCARCGEPLRPDEPFDLDHADDRGSYLGPSHVACNRGAPRRAG